MADENTNILYEMHGTLRALDERTQHILAQATRTNGRVDELEKDVDTLKQDKASAKGWATGISVTIGAVWSIVNFLAR